MQQLCNFRTFFLGGIDSNLRPCVLRSVVNPPFRPLVIGSIGKIMLLSKSGQVKLLVTFFLSYHISEIICAFFARRVLWCVVSVFRYRNRPGGAYWGGRVEIPDGEAMNTNRIHWVLYPFFLPMSLKQVL